MDKENRMNLEDDNGIESSKNSQITFGPTWLNKFSSNENSKNSTDVAFQLAKHRYETEEMLKIFEKIEKKLINQSMPTTLSIDFEDLFKKDRSLQRPVLLSPETPEEKKCYSTCVNSQLALNSYNKLHGQTSTSSSGNRSTKEQPNDFNSRNNLTSSRGSRNGGLNSKISRNRNQSDEETNQSSNLMTSNFSSSSKGTTRGGYSKGSFSRVSTSTSWKEREPQNKREFSKFNNNDNWRESEISKDEDNNLSNKETDKEPILIKSEEDSKKEKEKYKSSSPITKIDNLNRKQETDKQNQSKNYKSQPSNSKENAKNPKQNETFSKEKIPIQNQPKNKNQNVNDTYDNYSSNNRRSKIQDDPRFKNRKPAWFNDSNNYDAEDSKMTFDDTGKYVQSKEIKDQEEDKFKEDKPKLNNKKLDEKKDREKLLKKSDSSTSTTSSSDDSKNMSLKSPKNDSILSSNESKMQDSSLESLTTDIDPLTSSPIKTETTLRENLIKEKSESQSLNEFKRIISESQQNMIDADRWFFIDSHNQIQGSFSSEQMAAWFGAGYFSMNLMIKRGKDEKFLPLSVYINNFGYIPFLNEAQVEHYQVYQQMQLQNHLQNQMISQQQQQQHQQKQSTIHPIDLLTLSQQLQQLQLQQKIALASMNNNNLGENETQNKLNDLRMQHDILINQLNNQHLRTNMHSTPMSQRGPSFDSNINEQAVLDPSLKTSRLSNSSLKNSFNQELITKQMQASNQFMAPRIVNNLLDERNLISNSVQPSASSSNLNLSQLQMLAAASGTDLNIPTDKVNLFLELLKKEEKRRKIEEIQLKVKQKEEKRLLEEIRLKQQEELKRTEEFRLKEEIRKEIQRKKLEEIIKKQEEDKRNSESRLKKQLEEQKIIKLFQQKQEQLNKLQQQSQYSQYSNNNELKSFLEQQALEQKLMIERYKQTNEIYPGQ